MKEAKRVCPLESIVTTAITQVIWPTLKFLIREWVLRIYITGKFPTDAEADNK